MASLMDKFSTYFGLKLAHHVFAPAELASKALQGVDMTSQEGRLALNTTRIFYQEQQEPAAFQKLYSQTLAEAQDKTDEPKLPRDKKKPRRFLDGQPPPLPDMKIPKKFTVMTS